VQKGNEKVEEDEMTNDEIRMKIAELKGWTFVDKKAFVGCKDTSGLSAFVECPNWPEKIVDAWELAIEAGLSVVKSGNGYLAGRYDLDQEYLDEDMGIIDGHFSRGYAEANTAPRAICLAWIAWKESENSK
jgi:hypothetical protein